MENFLRSSEIRIKKTKKRTQYRVKEIRGMGVESLKYV